MSRPRVVNLFQSFPSTLLRAAHDAGQIEHICLPSAEAASTQSRREWFKSQLPGAQAAIVWSDVGKFGKEHLDIAGDGFKILATYSVGYDHVDVDECRRRGVAVGYTPHKSGDSVANAAVMLLLMAMRRVVEHMALARRGGWTELHYGTSATPLALNGLCLRQKTVGIYGFGPIAQKVAERLLSTGPRRILYKASQPRPFTPTNFPRLHNLVTNFYDDTTIANEPDLPTLAAECDFLVCLSSLTPETYHSINTDVLARMKRTAVIVNVARGAIIDTPALVDALRKDEIFCAALDVVEGEPNVPADHPLLHSDLAHKVIMTPHSASSEADARVEMAELTARNILSVLGIAASVSDDGAQDTSTHFLCTQD